MERNRTVKDYLDLLNEGTGLLLVGGQAVNLWAERYQAEETKISSYQPFTSLDADFYRRTTEMHLPANWREIPNPTKGRVRIVSHVLEGPEGQTAEVLRSVNGLSEKELNDGAIPIEYAGSPMWFLVPPTLFQAKLANVRSLDQKDRQDVKHLKLLVPITNYFFAELLSHHQSPERPSKAIDWMSQHANNIREAVSQGYLSLTDWSEFFPVDEMLAHASEAVRNFAKYQLIS